MPQLGFEPTIPVFERAKTVQALDCSVTLIDSRIKLTSLKHFNEPNNSLNFLITWVTISFSRKSQSLVCWADCCSCVISWLTLLPYVSIPSLYTRIYLTDSTPSPMELAQNTGTQKLTSLSRTWWRIQYLSPQSQFNNWVCFNNDKSYLFMVG
jgi:hypothetical protein